MGVLTVLSIVLVIAALSLLFRLAARIEEENRMLESGLETSRIYNEVLNKKISEIRRLRHDTAGLLQAIDMYASGPAEDTRGAGMAGDAEAGDAGTAGAGGTAGNVMPLLEAVIELKKRQCAEAGIAFECADELAELAGRALKDTEGETDLCLLAQNLLDNAYEANLRIEDKSARVMKLEARIESASGAAADSAPDRLVIKVSNRVADDEKVSFLTRKNRAELHGIGLRIVDDILKKYGGSRSVSADRTRHMFTTTIRLKLSEPVSQ